MKKMDKLTIFALSLIFIGNIGGILIVIFQSNNSSRDKDEIIKTTNENNNNLKEQLVEIKKERENLKSDLSARDLENKNKSEEIIHLNTELLKKSEELNKFLGASDAFPILVVSPISVNNGSLNFNFIIGNEFDYPIYDIGINVFDFQYIIENSVKNNEGKFLISKNDFEKSMFLHNEEQLIPANSRSIIPKNLLIEEGILYAKLKSRRGFIFEKIAFVKIGNEMAHGFMIYDQENNVLKTWYSDSSKEVKQKINEKFKIIPKSVSMIYTE